MAEVRPITTDTFIFCFVRMNPPTPGHLELIKKIIYKAIELDTKKVYVLLSTTVDEKNPLVCESEPVDEDEGEDAVEGASDQFESLHKKPILKKMIAKFKQGLIHEEQNPENIPKLQQLTIIVRCAYGNPFRTIYSILTKDFETIDKINIFFIVGRDRVEFLDSVADQLIVQDKINTIDGLIIERSGMKALLERPDIDTPISEISKDSLSASYVRKLVKHQKIEQFIELYTPYLSPPNIRLLFETIQRGLPPTTHVPVQTEATGTPTLMSAEVPDPVSKYFEGEHAPLFYTTEQKQAERTRREEERARKEVERAKRAEEKKRVKTTKSEGGKRKKTIKYKNNKRKSRRF
jgi:hypothetical protein